MALHTFAETNLWVVSNLESTVHIATTKAEAIGLSVQAQSLLDKNQGRTKTELALLGMGIVDLMHAGEDWLVIGDNDAIRRCLDKIQPAFRLLITQRAPIKLISSIDDLNNVASAVDDFESHLEQYENGRYRSEALRLKLQNNLFKKRVEEDREANLR